MGVFEEINSILDRIEDESREERVTTKDRLRLEAEKMYTYHALGICLGKLSNTSSKDNRDAIGKTRSYLEKIERIDF